MARFRKKPVVIEAFQMTEAARNDNRDWPEWLNAAWQKRPTEEGSLFVRPLDGSRELAIATLEGPLMVQWDDWIIRGVKGEIYPCKPDIFAATYEPADEEAVVFDAGFRAGLREKHTSP